MHNQKAYFLTLNVLKILLNNLFNNFDYHINTCQFEIIYYYILIYTVMCYIFYIGYI